MEQMDASKITAHMAGTARVLFAGDVHSNVPHAQGLARLAVRAGADLVIQVGDFNYFPHLDDGLRFLRIVTEAAEETQVPWLFIDGNHDNHDALAVLDPDESGTAPVEWGGWLRYVPRGARLDIGGARFGFLGGAYSIDKGWRTPGFDWWHGEEPSELDLDRLGRDPLDVLVTHDAPAGFRFEPKMSLPAAIENASYQTRMLLAEAVERTRPSLVVTGHWHRRETHQVESATVEVLDCDGSGYRSWLLLDVPDLRVIGDRRSQAEAIILNTR